MKLTDIIDALSEAGIKAYLPGRHTGKCDSAYCVVADDGVRALGKTTGRHMYIVTLYVPYETPTDMDDLLPKVRKALIDMDNLRETGEQSADGVDEDIEAYYVTLGYKSLCSLI